MSLKVAELQFQKGDAGTYQPDSPEQIFRDFVQESSRNQKVNDVCRVGPGDPDDVPIYSASLRLEENFDKYYYLCDRQNRNQFVRNHRHGQVDHDSQRQDREMLEKNDSRDSFKKVD